jgi:Transcriptional regulator
MSEYTIPNLKNACRIIFHISECVRPLSAAELSKSLAIPRTSAIRILETLKEQNFLKEDGRKYSLGPAIAEISKRTNVNSSSIADLSAAFLKRLTEISGETSHVGIFSNGKILILKVCDSPKPLHAASRAGVLADIHCSATGKAILAHLSQSSPELLKRVKLTKRTSATIDTAEKLKKNLKTVLDKGYALDDEEYHDHVRCLAAPIFDKNGKIAAAIGITAPSVRFAKSDAPKIGAIVRNIAEEFTARLADA